ncbi:MAG: hypothetical protein HY918_06160 [Candidatus Doudnabacteria bacterium]|nr:hypothetical protein [Candidatus Doudnabacteria bacterium]
MKIEKSKLKNSFLGGMPKAETLKKNLGGFLIICISFSQTIAPWAIAATPTDNASANYTTEQFYPEQILQNSDDSLPYAWAASENALTRELADSAPLEQFSTSNSAVLANSKTEATSTPSDLLAEQPPLENNNSTTTASSTNIEVPPAVSEASSTEIKIYEADVSPANLSEQNQIENSESSTSPDVLDSNQNSPTNQTNSTETEITPTTTQSSDTEITPSTTPSSVTPPAATINNEDNSSTTPPDIASATPVEILPTPELSAPVLEYGHFTSSQNSSDKNNFNNPAQARIKLSFASLPLIAGKLILEYSVASSSWQTLSTVALDGQSSNAERNGFFSAELPQTAINDLSTLHVRLKISAPQTSWQNILPSELFYLDSIWLEADYKNTLPEIDEDQLAATDLGNLTPEEFAHLDFFSPLMELFMPADLSANPITVGSKKLGFNSLPLQMLPINVSTDSPATRLGQKVTYADAYKSTDLEYIMSDSGLKENIILKDKNHPSKFRYLTNLDKYDSVQTSSSTIALFAKGHKGQPLYQRYVLSAPIMTDSQGQVSSRLEFKVNKNLITLIPDPAWLKTASYPVTVDPNVSLSVLNVSSFPVAGEFWTIDFTTVGQDNLTITPADQATVDDMEFSSLTCDGNPISANVSAGGQVAVNNWSCDGIGEVKFLDKKTGHHQMIFNFGDASQDAYNGSNTWNGLAGDSNWATGGNWSLGTAPALADDVVISTAATINISSSTAINSLTLGNSGGGVATVLNFNYDAIGGQPLSITGNLTVYSGASITHTVSSAGSVVGTVNISTGGNSTITGSISLNAKGYTGGYGPGKGTDDLRAGGGGYGGNGGTGNLGALGGTSNGSTTVPTSLGSGGGNSGCGSTGGTGGGALKLSTTGTTTIAGTITANGGTGATPCWNSGGGSGGSIYIITNVLTGAGSITANGGVGVTGGNASGDGGGGRIAINYTTDNSTITYSAYSGAGQLYGGSGTVYKKSQAQSTGDLTFDNNNLGGSTDTSFGKSILGSASYNSITIKNSASLYLTASSATATTLTLSNNGLYDAKASTTLSYSTLNWGGIIVDSGGTLPVLNQNQDITIPTSSILSFNVLSGTRTYNNVTVNGTLTNTANSSATTGTVSLYKINWSATNNLTVGPSGSINVDSKGYPGGAGPGAGGTGTQAGGGGYGGKGGASPTPVAGGVTYGSTSSPVSLGSGGGNTGCGTVGGIGGGAVQLTVSGTTTILGTISANGANGGTYPCWNSGAGSGGSIFITTSGLAGTGTVSANGGSGVAGGSASGDGGGGRISIIATTNSASLTRTVNPGTSYTAGAPGLGTTYPTDFPSMSTQAVSNNITGTSVTGNGTINSINYYPITQYGHVWSTWVNPTVPNTDITDGGFGTATSSKYNQGVVANAFDNSTSTFWGSDQGTPYDVEYDFATTTVVNKYIIISSPSGAPTDSPKDWQFQAWDGASWVNLQSVSSQTAWGNTESRAFTLVNTTPYTKYRLYITANNGGGWTRFAEFQMLNTSSSVAANGATTTPGAFTSNISGLSPNTTYYTRSYATTQAGIAYGDNISFSTGNANNAPNSPSSLGPNNFTSNTWTTSTAPTLTFNLTDPDGSDTVKYRIILDNDSNFSSPLIDYTSSLQSQGAASFTVGQSAGSGSYSIGTAGQTLSDNSSYYWEVQAIDSNTLTSSFTVANSGSIAFKVDTTAPVAGTANFGAITETLLIVTSSGSSDAGSGIASYYYRNFTNSTTYGPNLSASWNDSGLTPNTQYSFNITLTDGVGLTSTTATSSAYTLANIPSSPTTTVISNSSILLSWNNNSNPANTEYYAENSTSAFNSGWITGTSTLFTGLSCGTSYTFHVRARNAVGTVTSYSASVSPSASPCNNNPNTPSSLGYSQYTNGGWTNQSTPILAFSLTDSDASDTIKYRVQVATSSDFSALVADYTSPLQAQGAQAFTVGQATSTGSYAVGFAGQTLADNSNGYYWRVMAIDNSLATSSWASAAGGAVAFKLETVAPTVGSLSVTSTTTNAVSLSFSGASDSGSGLTATPYIYFNTSNWNSSGNTAATTWTNSGLAAGTYSYKVRVTDNAGNYTEALLPQTVTVSGDGGGGGGGGSDPWTGGVTNGFSVFINQNDSITNTNNVTLQLTGQPGTTQMLISNLSNFSGASLEPYDTTKFWDLCSGLGSCLNGTYTVYAKFYNSLSQSSGTVSDSITYQILNSLNPGTLSLTGVSTSTASILISGSSDAVYGLAASPYTFINRTNGNQSATSSVSSWINTGLTPNTQYYYYAIVGNANSTYGYTSDISAYTLANPPTLLATTSITSSSIGLAWSANNNPVGTEYQILNQTAGTSSGWITSTSTTISDLTCANSYSFKVKARNANGVETTYSNLITESTSACPVTPPPSGGGGGGGGGGQPVVPPTDTTPTPALVCPAPGEDEFNACFYNSMDLSSPAATGTTKEINFDWGFGSPATGVRVDNFSARWQGYFNFENGLYRFSATSDDGARVYVDDQLVISQWNDHPATRYTNDIRLSAGRHYVLMDYYDNMASAIAKLSWQKIIASPATSTPPQTPPQTPPSTTPTNPQTSTNPSTPTNPPVVVVTPPVSTTIIPPTAPITNPSPATSVTPTVPNTDTKLSLPTIELPDLSGIGNEVKILSSSVLSTSLLQAKKFFSYALVEPVSSLVGTMFKIRNSSHTAVGVTALTLAPASFYLEYSLASYGLNINAAGTFADIWLRLLQWFYGLLAITGLKRKRRYWGTVYDSESKQPLDPAIVELIDPATGKVIEQNITDMHGRFGFLDRPGKFIIRSTKTNYRFPSEIVLGKTDLVFDNLYHGEKLEIASDNDIITPNIPMDPMAFDWNQMDKQRVVKINPRMEYIFHIILQTLFWSGALFVLINFILLPNLFNSISALFYVVMVIMRKLIPHAHLWGRVVFHNGERANHLLLELHPVKIPTVVTGRAVSAESGKFFLKAMPGNYILTVKKVDGLNNTILYKQEVTVGKEGVVNEIISL